MEQLYALQKAVPYLLTALGVKAESKFINAGICDSSTEIIMSPNMIVINISENKTLMIWSQIKVDVDPAARYQTAYIRCKSEPDTEQ